MKLFTEDRSLKSINDILGTQILDYSLIGDLPLSYKDFLHLASRVGLLYKSEDNKHIYSNYKESISVFLVFCAVYEYDDKTFWKPIEKYVGKVSNAQKNEMYSIFSEVLYKYNLNKFKNESEEGYTHVTPILCHAGIPVSALEAYFEAISNTVNDTFYDDFSTEDYLAYLKNKTEMTVKRYIKLTNKRDSYNFIQNTRKLILCDSVDEDEEMENGNYIRMSEQLVFWKEKPKIKKNLQARKNVQITAPKIKIDLDGIGIYCEIPRIVVKDCYDSYIVWEISSDETTNLVKSDFFRRSGVLVSEEKIITLKPAQTYTIALKVDDNLISKWEFDGVKHSHIAFAQNGNMIKTKTLPNTNVILLLDQNADIIGKEELSIAELTQIPLWHGYKVYRIDLLQLSVLECNGFNIVVNSENKPIIDGGETLFKQENTKTYIKLPYIKVPILNEGEWHLEIKRKAENNVISKLNEIAASDNERIILSSYIDNEGYGNYDIKIWNRTGINEKFSIEYVPYSTIIIDQNAYWPSSYNGYQKNILLIKANLGVELEIYNAEKASEINHDDYTVHRYKVDEKERFLIGEFRYTSEGHVFSTSIKSSIHPVSWGIIGVGNEIIDLSSKVHTLTVQDFSNTTDPFLLFAFDFKQMYDIRYLRFDLVGPDKKAVLNDIISIKNKDGLRIPLNSYLFEVQNSSEIDYHLRISLIDSNEMVVSSFLVARIQEEVVVKNARYSQNDNNISITWEEMGTKCGRECILLNFLKPWLKPYHFRIEDKSCEISFSSEILEEGIYGYVIQKEADDLFFEEVESEICSLRDFQKDLIIVKGKYNYSTDFERTLNHVLKSRFIKKELLPKLMEQINSEIYGLRAKPEDINLIAQAYILHDRFFAKKEDYLIIMELFESMFNLFSIYSKDTLRYVLDSDFSVKYKKELLHKFYCNNLTSTTRFNDIQLKKLSDIDENMAGFINLIQANHNVKGLNWAGISDVGVLCKEDLFGDGDDDTTFLSNENLGKSSYITKYYEYVYNSIQHPKNMSKSTEDFIREFQKEQEVQETMIFGKTRLHLLAEWKDKNSGARKIQERLSQILHIPCEIELKEQFKAAFGAIAKRKKENELGYYIGLIALYASFIRNGLMRERNEFSHLINYTIDKCEKLYYRDAIVIELYMHLERGYSWV
jgi:hypothetical protein